MTHDTLPTTRFDPQPRRRRPSYRKTADEQLEYVASAALKAGEPIKYRFVGTLYDSVGEYVGDRRKGIIVELETEAEALAYRRLVERVAELVQKQGIGTDTVVNALKGL